MSGNINNRRMILARASSSRDVIGLLAILVVLAIGLFLLISRKHGRRDADPLASCEERLSTIGKAMSLYREANDDYFPFSWQRAGEAEPEGFGTSNAAMAMTSIANLYPNYIGTSRAFFCPATESHPLLKENESTGERSGDHNWTLFSGNNKGVSYGCDPRISPRAGSRTVVIADMDGSFSRTQNHIGYQNVLYSDMNVGRWKSNFGPSARANTGDNIFSENAEDADNDAFLLDTDGALRSSFLDYGHLHYLK